MSGWIVFGFYLAGWLFTYRRAYLAIASAGMGHDVSDRVASAVIAMGVCIFWPVVLVGYGVWRFLTPVTPAQRQRDLDEREARIREMERDLREMERNLKIGQDD